MMPCLLNLLQCIDGQIYCVKPANCALTFVQYARAKQRYDSHILPLQLPKLYMLPAIRKVECSIECLKLEVIV